MPTSDEAFVFARLADGVRIVGRYRYRRSEGSRAIGEFGYAGSWLAYAGCFPLDPVNLPLSDEVFQTTKRGCLFGPLADATPDRWGRELIHRRYPGRTLSPVEWLLESGPDRVGCLDFSATTTPTLQPIHRLGIGSIEAIASEFQKIEAGQPADPDAESIYKAGTSLGGARPKAVIEIGSALWIAKFERATDTFDQCSAEHATMMLARACGIDAAETRLIDVGPRKAVLVKRFDRSIAPDARPTAHFLSALSLLNEDETSPEGSYYAIAAELLRHSAAPHEDRAELFRRMVFNVLCGNRDDHLKNHALLRGDKGWRLSPAFDIVPQPDMPPAQAIALGRSGVFPSLANCMSRCGDFGLSEEAATSEIRRLCEVTASWEVFFARSGTPQTTIGRIAPAFNLAGA